MKDKEECPLCMALKCEKEKILYENGTYVIMPTKDLKGHKKRVMVVLKYHANKMPKSIESLVLRSFIAWCKNYFDEEPTFALVEPTYASIPKHWHRIACDWHGTPKEIKQLHYTPHQAVMTHVRWSP